MRKKTLIIFTILFIFVSCKTTKDTNCDAYSQNIKKTNIKYRTDKQDIGQNVFVY
jgi:hypothetical protein